LGWGTGFIEIMAIKRTIYILVLAFIMIFLLKSCINADIPENTSENTAKASFNQIISKSPGEYKTVEINGVEYKQTKRDVGKYGGSIYVSEIGEGPKTFNPWDAKDNTSSSLAELMFDGLTTTDAYTGKVIPQLAKSIEVDKTGTVYTVKLRKGLKWSDGKPITADDAVFTWNDIVFAGFGNTSIRDNILIDGQTPIVEAVDPLTIKFTTPKPFAPFLRQLSTPIAPKHVFQPIVAKGKGAFSSFWGVTTNPKKFVTSGKFKLSEYVPAQRVKFVRNPDYYMIDKKGNKLPYLDNYVVYIVGDQNNEVLKFEAQEIDVLSVGGSNVARFKQLEKHSNYKMYNLGPATGTMFLSFNLNTRKNEDNKYYVDPKKQKWFNDINFRTAVDYAVDRESMVTNILSGVGAPLFTAESLQSIYLYEKIKNGHERNIEKARELLKQSGFKWDKKGRLLDKEGNIVEFNLYTNAGNTERESTGVMVKQDLEELGMTVNFKPIEFNVLVGKLVNTFDWDAVIMGLTGNSLEPHSGRNVWSSTGALHMFNMRSGKDLENRADLLSWEEKLDQIFERGAQEINFEKRKKIYNEYQEIVYKEKPFIYLYSPLRIVAIRNRFGNIDPTPLGGSIHNIEEIYVK